MNVVLGVLALLGAVVSLVVFAASLNVPLVGLGLLLVTLPFERWPSIELASLSVRMTTVLIPVVATALIVRRLLKKSFRLHPDPTYYCLLFLLGSSCLSTYFAWFEPSRSTVYTLLLAFALLGYVTVAELMKSQKAIQLATTCLLAAAAGLGLFGLFQFFGDLAGLPSSLTGLIPGYQKATFGFPRIHTVSLEPLYFANYLLLPLGIVLGLTVEEQKQTTVRWVLLLLLLFNLVFTLSRGGYAAVAVMSVLLAPCFLRRFFDPRRFVIIGLSVVLIGAATVGILNRIDADAVNRFVGHVLIRSVNAIKGQSVVERTAFRELALLGFRDHPLVGLGPGNFGPSVNQERHQVPEGGWKIVNNQYLETLAETGVIGFAALVIFLVVLGSRLLCAFWAAPNPYYKGVTLGLLVAFIGMLVQWWSFSTIYSIPIWLTFGLMAGVSSAVLEKKG